MNKIKEFYLNRPEGYHVDHIIPLSKGGRHCIGNLAYLTSKENMLKSDKIDIKHVINAFRGSKISEVLLQRKFKVSYEMACSLMKKYNDYYEVA
jgi:CRISPR/Cas system Type II protein with McrA/HNH and RuvC-like nuclease domain